MPDRDRVSGERSRVRCSRLLSGSKRFCDGNSIPRRQLASSRDTSRGRRRCWVATAIHRGVRDKSDGNPMKRRARPEEISSVVTFLASEGGSFMTGSQIYTDGGVSQF
ncbi:MAG: SDR family oxidoreductase [Actinomycetota bacterium]